YDFLNLVNGLFVDSENERLLTDFYTEFTGQSTDYRAVVREKKRLVLAYLFGSELSHLDALLADFCCRHSVSAAFGRETIGRALAEVIVCFPVYRTYIRPETGNVDARDRAVVREAVGDALILHPDIPAGIWEVIGDLLTLVHTGEKESEFVWRFQQLTGPVMAKGVEDTTFYCFNRLIALNEVGGNPGEIGTSPDVFHNWCLQTQSQWPQTMLATSTHDTKRGEDTRLRIGLLSEIPKQWIDAVRRWSRMNGPFRRNGFPDANTEYFLYQTLVGAWPIGADRLGPAMLKAAKEAKVFTSWMDPDPVFEKALMTFIGDVMGHADFISDLLAFLEPLAWPALVTSLSQTLIKCTAPGVPDVYQGTELWDRSLADPDNRRPIDFNLRRRLLAQLDTLSVADILDKHKDGLPKLFLMQRVLLTRRQRAAAFGSTGSFRPLSAKGECAGHLVAFMRGNQVVTLAPRRVMGLNRGWKNTVIELPEGTWKNVFGDERYHGGPQKLSHVLGQFPVALLVREGSIQ
ncbi:MAG TPA: malto-oligosyltrehalose synthase, partial [Desulfatirhabdiaceae bacterium]|nr:malto-oligosyltrehalose synthase [Desulfatirhabdiaceae bacterium]